MNTKQILLVIALICFILAAFGVPGHYVSLLPVGLAFWVGSQLVA